MLIPLTTNVPLLLLNLSSSLEKDLLLQPNFYTTEPLTHLFGGAPAKWHERVETKRGRVIRVRDGSVSIENKVYPPLTLVIHKEISRPAGKAIVLDGPAPQTPLALPLPPLLPMAGGGVTTTGGAGSFTTTVIAADVDGAFRRYTLPDDRVIQALHAARSAS